MRRQRLLQRALAAGVNQAQYQACMDKHLYQKDVDAQFHDALDEGILRIPVSYVNGKQIMGTGPRDAWQRLIDDALAAKKG